MPERPLDHAGMEILGPAECLRLLWSHQVGRIAFVERGEPQVLPVHYRLHDNKIVFRSAVGAKLDAAIFQAPVAFEVDGADEEHGKGWSVLVHGTARQVEDETEIGALEALGLEAWVQGGQPLRWIEIQPNEISGRRIPS
ncbi:MAG TPA: pyridoxamine 5'-phosphate oxidase family protein [Acidimicrobiia bacterium]|nr:pyridoxamine 5'-phosphate oxidase family protein [Acidimicrobiia bacterium]